MGLCRALCSLVLRLVDAVANQISGIGGAFPALTAGSCGPAQGADCLNAFLTDLSDDLLIGHSFTDTDVHRCVPVDVNRNLIQTRTIIKCNSFASVSAAESAESVY